MNRYYSLGVPLIGMMAVLGIAYALDNWMNAIRQAAMSDFAGTLPWLVPSYLADLVVAGLILALLWFVHAKGDKGLTLPLVYVIVGLGWLFYNVLAIGLAGRLPLPMQLSLVPQSLPAFASAFIAVIGLQRLILRQAAL
jgi:hypothetical protein